MYIEYEATFPHIDKEDMRGRLLGVGALLRKPEFLQKRVVFHLPTGHEIQGGWLRVRDEGDKITMTLKVIDGDAIENQKEWNIAVSDFERACGLLESLGARRKAYQETKRELWMLNGVEITLDEWPFLDPLLEIEGESEESVQQTALALGLDWNGARFCHAGVLFSEEYGFPQEVFNDKTPLLLFNMENPFLKEKAE